jgi:hypothetical protein
MLLADTGLEQANDVLELLEGVQFGGFLRRESSGAILVEHGVQPLLILIGKVKRQHFVGIGAWPIARRGRRTPESNRQWALFRAIVVLHQPFSLWWRGMS